MTASATGVQPRRLPSARHEIDRSPLGRLATAPLSLLFAPLVILGGVAILVWDYALLPAEPMDHLLYWVGLGVAYVGVVLLGSVARPGAGRQLIALAVVGAVLWLPSFLRSPERMIFADELYHRDVAQRILETGHAIGLPVTLYPLPGTFPGIEHVAIAVMGATGLSLDGSIRAVTLAIHMTIPCLAYLVARGSALGRRGAFLAALVYAANTAFIFFHALFSYETLGILLFLSVWALIAWYAPSIHDGGGHRRAALVLVSLPLVVAIAVTHHVSSYMLAGSLVVGWLAARVQRSPAAPGIRDVAIMSILADIAWFVVSMDRLVPYLGSSLVARVQTIVGTLLTQQQQARTLFANPDQPQLERLLAFSYPPLVLGLTAIGLWIAWQHRGRSVMWLPLAVVGPIAWVLTTPAVFTRAGEIAYRSWPFLFLGVSVFAALGLLHVARRVSARVPGLGPVAAFALVGVLLFGGISIGENQSGRFPTPPRTAAGGAANTDDVVAAARWLRAQAGDGHVVAADSGTAVPFAVDGRQRILGWASWYPFLVADPREVATFVREAGIEYLVLDRRITTLPPRYGSYFGAPPVPADMDPGAPIPAEVLATLDETPSLERIYAGPNIVIYRVLSNVAVPGAG